MISTLGFSGNASGDTGCFARQLCAVLPVTLHVRRLASRISLIFLSSKTRGMILFTGQFRCRPSSAFVASWKPERVEDLLLHGSEVLGRDAIGE